MDTCLLKMTNIHKSFPGVYALRGANLQVDSGEVMALVGENGAGKSTIINVLGGIYAKDDGEILINGEHVDINGVLKAQELGISIIHQELVLVPHLTVAENIFINREPHKGALIDYPKMYAEATRFIADLGLDINARSKIKDLTIAQQQMVEIVKAVSFNARIVVMDEPTSSLSDHEINALFANIKKLKALGIGIIYISHRLSELKEIADKVTVFRDGQSVATHLVSEVTNDLIVKEMVGREVVNYYTRTFNPQGRTVLSVKGLTTPKVSDVSFELHAGEILGFSGLVGAGRTETIHGILGFDPVLSGEVLLNGKALKNTKPAQAYSLGIGYIPEDRRDEGLFAVQPIRFNLTLCVLKEFIKTLFTNKNKEHKIADDYIDKLRIKTASTETRIQNLSGGNQQKAIIARWLATKPDILIMDEPTRGIDVGAKAEIYELMNQLAAEGIAILMISSEMPEIIGMSDRVVVMNSGKVAAILEHDEITQERIMQHAVNI